MNGLGIGEGDGVPGADDPVAQRARLLRAPALRAERQRRRAAVHARDRARVHVVVLHEALGRGVPLAVPERARDGLLRVEREPVGAALGDRVEPVANAHVEHFGGERGVEIAPVDRSALDQEAERFGPRVHVDAQHPSRDVEITKPASTELHLGLEQIDRVAVALVTLLRVGRERACEPVAPCAGVRTRGVNFRDELREDVHRARHGSEIEQARRRGDVVLREAEQLTGRRELVPHAEPRVPQRVEERVREGASGARPADQHEPHVDVAAEAHRPAPVAPRRRDHEGSLPGIDSYSGTC